MAATRQRCGATASLVAVKKQQCDQVVTQTGNSSGTSSVTTYRWIVNIW
jgi:hypothetical protein